MICNPLYLSLQRNLATITPNIVFLMHEYSQYIVIKTLSCVVGLFSGMTVINTPH